MRRLCDIRVSLRKFGTRHDEKRALAFVGDFNILFTPLPVINLGQRFALAFKERDTFARYTMHIFQMATEVSALSERLFAFGTSERALTSVLSKVIP